MNSLQRILQRCHQSLLQTIPETSWIFAQTFRTIVALPLIKILFPCVNLIDLNSSRGIEGMWFYRLYLFNACFSSKHLRHIEEATEKFLPDSFICEISFYQCHLELRRQCESLRSVCWKLLKLLAASKQVKAWQEISKTN